MTQLSCSTACGTAQLRLHLREVEMQLPLYISACGHVNILWYLCWRRCRYIIECRCPLAGMQYFECISAKRRCSFHFVFPLVGMSIFHGISASGDAVTIFTVDVRLRECNIFSAFTQAELSVLICNPARWKCKFICASPLAGIVNRNDYKISAAF